MNYLEIILKGYFDKNTKKYFSDYLYREWKKAEKENYDLGEFFNGLIEVGNIFVRNLNDQRSRDISDLTRALKDFQDKGHKEKAQKIKDEMNSISIEDYTIHLASLTNNKYFDTLFYDDIAFIVDGINKAWKKVLAEINEKQPQQKEENPTELKNQKKIIEDHFSNIDEKGWEYAFRCEEDYNLFVDLLTKFFEQKKYKLPDNIIELKRDCKTKLAITLRDIHRDIGNKKLSADYGFFEIIRILSHFKELNNSDIKRALSK
jgi:L-rhamnose mutarotase